MIKKASSKNTTRAVTLVLTVLLAILGYRSPAAEATGPQVEQTVEVNVDTTTVINKMRGGIGASWHAMEKAIPIGQGGSAWGAYPPAEDEQAWRQIYRHADWLGLNWNRVEIEQRVYEPERDRFTFDTPEMRILYRILDWNQRRGTDVFFQQMWCNAAWLAYPEFRYDPSERVHSAPNDLNAFADGLATLMDYLITKRGYTCIKWLCINNEPGSRWSWWRSPTNSLLSIQPGLEAVRQALAKRGIKLPLSGPDVSWGGFPATVPGGFDYLPLLGAYDFHDYNADFDFRSDGHIAKQVRSAEVWARFSHAEGKPLFLSEFGTMAYGWKPDKPGPGSPPSVLVGSELVIRLANAGVDGFNRWSFLNRGDLDGQWQLLDTWDRQRKKLLTDFAPHPNSYYCLGLLSRFTAKNSSVLASHVSAAKVDGWQRVFSAAFRSPRGNLTIAIVNDSPIKFPLYLSWSGKLPAEIFYCYHYTEDQRDLVDVKVNSQGEYMVAPGSNGWRSELPPKSLTIYSTYRLNHDDSGIMVDGSPVRIE